MSVEITSKVRNLANDLKAAAELNKDTREVVFAGEEDIFTKHLKEGVTLDVVKDVQDELLDFAAARTLAHGEFSNEQGKADKELTQTTSKGKIGYSQFDSSWDRERSGTAMGKPWKKNGVTATDLTLGAGRKSGQYKAAVAFVGEQAASIFAN